MNTPKRSTIKLAKTAYVGYIYADGHAVIIHKEHHAKAGDIEWVEIFEKIDTFCNFSGRIVFHHPNYDARLHLALNAYAIRCAEPSTESGSENTKRQGIRIGYFEIESRTKDSRHTLSWVRTPDLISDGLTYQPEDTEVFADIADKYTWGMNRIDVIHRIEREQAPASASVAA